MNKGEEKGLVSFFLHTLFLIIHLPFSSFFFFSSNLYGVFYRKPIYVYLHLDHVHFIRSSLVG